jgi:replicative DNA helicase
MNEDRTPPQCIEIEKCILSAFFASHKSFLQFSIKVKPEYFYHSINRKIFVKMQELNITDMPVISESIPGVELDIADIVENYCGNANLDAEIVTLKDRYERREIIAASNEAIEKSFTDFDCSPIEIIQNATAKISGCSEHYNPPEIIGDIIPRLYEKMEAAKRGENGLKTGVSDIDNLIGGFLDDEYIIIAGRPSMGKTMLALQIARYNAIQNKIPTLIFSIETGKTTLTGRIVFGEAGVAYDAVMSNTLPAGDIEKINATPCHESQIYIDDTAAISINQIEAVSELYVKNHGIKLIIIDHIGLIKPAERGRSRHEELSEISKRIKACGKHNRVPIVAICQLSRSVESRKPPIPMLSDMRDSGSLEEDTDKVMFLYREEYYQRDSKKKGIAEIILAKNKNGKTGYKEVQCDLPTMTIHNLSNKETSWPND